MIDKRQVFIGLGSNLGDRAVNCLMALDLINAAHGCRVMARSCWYETEPVGMESEYWFINGVAMVQTSLSPARFMRLLLESEERLGRKRSVTLDRTVDLDLLYYNGETMGYDLSITPQDFTTAGFPDKSRQLVVPHPAIPHRRFVLAPWAELAPELCISPWGRSVREMLEALPPCGPEVRCLRNTSDLKKYISRDLDQ